MSGWVYAAFTSDCQVIADTPEECMEARLAVAVEKLGLRWAGYESVDWRAFAELEGEYIRVVPA